ncbi:MAG: site-2 protease family protein [Pirellulaceae bacterium]
MGFELMAASDGAQTIITVLKVAIGLGFVIFVHELGHFLVAKACGVKCEKFYIGFDFPMPFGLPSRLFRFQWGETEYGMGVFPLGGYVKMLGQDDNPLNAEEEAARTRMAGGESGTGPSTATAAVAPATRTYEIDPRSYTAKAVWQRMLIISAGVIMNLIFAVIFAAFAYRSGVSYTPCEIGQVVPGGPAWTAGIEPGMRIVQIGKEGEPRESLRFDFDLRQSVYAHGDGSDLHLLLRDNQGQEVWKSLRPVTIREGWESRSNIGISPMLTLQLAPEQFAAKESAAAQASPPLQGNDRVVAVDGQQLSDQLDLQTYLATYPDKAIQLTVQRQSLTGDAGSPVEVRVPAQPLVDVGLVMEYGPIAAIRPDSPAARAGLKVGDRIQAVAGQPVVDAMLLPEMLRPFHGRDVELTVERAGAAEPVAVTVTLTPPTSYSWFAMFGCPMASDALGAAYDVERTVRAVVPGSPAEKAGFQPGDVVTAMEFAWGPGKTQSKPLPGHDTVVPLDDKQYTWPTCFAAMQQMESDEVIKLIYERGGKAATASMTPVPIAAFNPDRGFRFQAASEIHQEQRWSAAIQLGARQTWEDAFRVVGMLKNLVTGRVSVANLGGIGSIAYVAGAEAKQGTARLLIFLTMLSANLAVLNFLPIPALDGGHMMFLLYEGIFRKPVNERLQVALTIVGVTCLLGLMIFVNAMDFTRFLQF